MLKKCSKRKGINRFIQRKDLLTKIKHCDVELSNVLQAFQVRALFLSFMSIALYISPAGRVVIGRPRLIDCGETRGTGHSDITLNTLR